MAGCSKKQYAIMMNSGPEGQKLASEMGSMDQEEFNKAFAELIQSDAAADSSARAEQDTWSEEGDEDYAPFDEEKEDDYGFDEDEDPGYMSGQIFYDGEHAYKITDVNDEEIEFIDEAGHKRVAPVEEFKEMVESDEYDTHGITKEEAESLGLDTENWNAVEEDGVGSDENMQGIKEELIANGYFNEGEIQDIRYNEDDDAIEITTAEGTKQYDYVGGRLFDHENKKSDGEETIDWSSQVSHTQLNTIEDMAKEMNMDFDYLRDGIFEEAEDVMNDNPSLTAQEAIDEVIKGYQPRLDMIRKDRQENSDNDKGKDEHEHLSNILKEYGVEIKPTPTHQSKYQIKSNKLPFAKREEITKKLESLGYEVQGDGNGNLNIWNSLDENQYNSKRNDWIINDFLEQYGYKEDLSPEERAVIAKILRLK